MGHKVYNRHNSNFFEEDTFGGSFIDWAYGTKLGLYVSSSRLIQKTVSQSVGAFMKSPLSKKRIEPFIRRFDIKMDEFIEPVGGFPSFNDFFIRPLKPGARVFPEQSQSLGAPAEGRVSVYPLKSEHTPLYIKGIDLSVAELLGERSEALNDFLGGWIYVFRLCPVDYHRFHFCDTGTAGEPLQIEGHLHSVNPLSLNKHPRAFLENERQVTLQTGAKAGPLAYIEVGAMCVGTIIQSFLNAAPFNEESKSDTLSRPSYPVSEGSEKGYFEFGGSTLILLTSSRVQPSADLLEKTHEGHETLIQLGDEIGICSKEDSQL